MKLWTFCILFVSLQALACAVVVMDWVTIGDPGNAADTTGRGAVNYEYRISSKEVTNAQYCEFLNAVAKADGSPYDLWNSNMEIERSGSSPNFAYVVDSGRDNYPVRYVSWVTAIRFINWLHNGQRAGNPGPGTTEDGAYTVGSNAYQSARNPNALYFLPTEDEWYKAAFYKGGSTSAGYWLYATSSDTAPENVAPPGGVNSANFNRGVTTTVGAYWQSKSPCQTYDQCGNVSEWTEEEDGQTNKPIWGGDFSSGSAPSSSGRNTVAYNYVGGDVGFRIVAWPEDHVFDTRQWTLIGDAGNAADTSGYGDVSYEFWIAKREATNTQYCEFLNAVAKAVDGSPYYLWNSNMEIERSGSSPNFAYAVDSGRNNYPVRYVSWASAIRYINWLHNGKSVGNPGSATTEDGAYTIGTYVYQSTRNPNALYWLPTEDEWYKAAFYKGSGIDAGYWLYATSSDSPPECAIPAGGINSANFCLNSPTAVGAYWQSKSPSGTYDQCGNVAEWAEESGQSNNKPIWGGDFSSGAAPSSSGKNTVAYDYIGGDVGFRVAAHLNTIVPEPVCTLYPSADLTRDCKVDLADFAQMAAEWLVCNLEPQEACNP